MSRSKGIDYIPNQDAAFFHFQRKLVSMVEDNAVSWNIPAPAVAGLVARRAAYEPLYVKIQNKNTRTPTDVLAHRQMRQIYEKEIRAFVNAHIRYNPAVPLVKKAAMGLVVLRPKAKTRPIISGRPVVELEPMGGGWIKVTCRRETDKDRPSMHKYADVIECRYTVVPIEPGVRRPWPKLDDCKEVVTSTKARFIIECGDKNAGQGFYGFFRWVNQTTPDHNGQWTNVKKVVIA